MNGNIGADSKCFRVFSVESRVALSAGVTVDWLPKGECVGRVDSQLISSCFGRRPVSIGPISAFLGGEMLAKVEKIHDSYRSDCIVS